MPQNHLRGARRAAPLVLFSGLVLVSTTALSGCSSSHRPTASATTAPSSTAPAAGNDPRAAQLLAKARATLAADRSYRFDATETVEAKTPATTRVTGAVVRDQGVSYTLTVGRTTTEVVRIKSATYVRTVPGRWARLARPRPVVDATASLGAILDGVVGGTIATASLGAGTATSTVAGTLTDAAAKQAGVPIGSEPAQVTIGVDPAGHVTRVTVHTVAPVAAKTGTSTVAVTVVTTYTDFDRVPALRAPR